MQIVNFKAKEPQPNHKKIIHSLFMLQKYKKFKVEKPTISKTNTLTMKTDNIKMIDRSVKVSERVSAAVRTKIIKKVRKDHIINVKKERKAQRLYNLYLSHFLNITNLEIVLQRQPPLLSVLETKEDGDYIVSMSGQYEKKDFPHYSNTLKPTQIPNQLTNRQLPLPPRKISQPQPYTIQDNCVFKIKQLYRFTRLLFKLGNQQFDQIADKLSTSIRNCKLLYDLYEDYFNVEDRLEQKNKSFTYKKSVRKINRFIANSLLQFLDAQSAVIRQSLYVSAQQKWIDLKTLRKYLSKMMQKFNSDQEEQQKKQQETPHPHKQQKQQEQQILKGPELKIKSINNISML